MTQGGKPASRGLAASVSRSLRSALAFAESISSDSELVADRRAEARRELEATRHDVYALTKAIAKARTYVNGGHETLPGDYPECVALGRRDNYRNVIFCSSGLQLGERWIVTVDHCAASVMFGGVSVGVAHQYELKYVDFWKRFVLYEVISLPRPAPVAVVFAGSCALKVNEKVVVVGFGEDSITPGAPGIQRFGREYLSDVSDPDILRTMPVSGNDIADGDSGGPAFVTTSSGRSVVGLGKASLGNPGTGESVFIRFSAGAITWLESKTSLTLTTECP